MTDHTERRARVLCRLDGPDPDNETWMDDHWPAYVRHIEAIDDSDREVGVAIEQMQKRIAELEARLTWKPIDENTPDQDAHFRGLWVRRLRDSTTTVKEWQCFYGYVDDDGEWACIDGGDCGWETSDLTHWMPLPTPPVSAGCELETSDD